ncbi:MAG: Tm-1-like ATP-binding domain-containing protein [Gemmobacter sp.]
MGDRILVVGTFDTKDDELTYLGQVIRAQGGQALAMDVSILGEPKAPTDWTKHQVIEAGGSTIAEAIAAEDENTAMQAMARGAATLCARLHREGRFDGVIVLGGSMGTDLALDLCAALPLGVPKYVVSTISFSPLIPPGRVAADIQMILWAGGLYGLNSVCKATLSQAAGAVLGAARAVAMPDGKRPIIAMSGFNSKVVTYMVTLKPALEARGFEVAVFHGTGMGGRALESLAAQGAFAAVMDLAPQEVANHLFGSPISAGADRMTNAGLRGIPQIVSVGCLDLVDLIGWQPLPALFADTPAHAHNRLLTTVLQTPAQRRAVAREVCRKLATATGPVVVVLPSRGGHCWDLPGGPLCDPEGLAAFCDEMRSHCPATATLVELDAHINDPAFAATVLGIFDDWLARGIVT